jgi:hypothetical protein
MTSSRGYVRVVAALILSVTAAPIAAQQSAAPFEPRVGQPGKDVVWVPTPETTVNKMLDLAKVTPADYVIDLGSGDGVTVITAAKRGARAHGIEYDPRMVELSKRNAETAQVNSRATFAKADLFESDFSEATVITMFLLPTINLQLRPKLLKLKPGTRVVSNTFDMAEWLPDEKSTVAPCERWCTALLWIVPASVEGTWRTPTGDLTLAQTFQTVSGTLGATPVANGRLRGDELSFTAGGAQIVGRVNGSRIEGTSTTGGRASAWIATRR